MGVPSLAGLGIPDDLGPGPSVSAGDAEAALLRAGIQPAKQGFFQRIVGDVGDALGSMQQGVLRTIDGVKSADPGEALAGIGVLGAGAGGAALGAVGGPVGAVVGANLGAMAARKLEGVAGADTSRLDAADTLGLHPGKGLLGTAERLGLNIATDPNTFILPGEAGLEAGVPLLRGGRLALGGIDASVPLVSTEALQAGGEALRGLPGVGGALGRTADAVQGGLSKAAAAVDPAAHRLAQLTGAGIDADRAGQLNSLYETARAQGQGARASLMSDFERELKAAGEAGPAQDAVLSRWMDRAGLQLSPGDVTPEAVREAVQAHAGDVGGQAFEDALAKAGIRPTVPATGADELPGVFANNDLQDAMSSPRNTLTGGSVTRANPEYQALQDLYRSQPSLQTGKLNQLYRQVTAASPASAGSWNIGAVVRNALDPEVSGVGNVLEAGGLQRALSNIPEDAIATLGVEGAARNFLSPEQFQQWTAAREQGVLGGATQAPQGGLAGLLQKAAVPNRAGLDNSRLANFLDRLSAGATPEEAAAGVRGTQYGLSDATPLVASARRTLSPGANFRAQQAIAGVQAAVSNPALVSGSVGAEGELQRPDNGLPTVSVLGHRVGVDGLLSTILRSNPAVDAVTGTNPVTAALQAASGDVKGAGDTLGHIPGGPTVGGLLASALQTSGRSGSQGSALDSILRDTLPAYKQLSPVAAGTRDMSPDEIAQAAIDQAISGTGTESPLTVQRPKGRPGLLASLRLR